eukprot:8926173-Alexandrium_andersonii.AAC.1
MALLRSATRVLPRFPCPPTVSYLLSAPVLLSRMSLVRSATRVLSPFHFHFSLSVPSYMLSVP